MQGFISIIWRGDKSFKPGTLTEMYHCLLCVYSRLYRKSNNKVIGGFLKSTLLDLILFDSGLQVWYGSKGWNIRKRKQNLFVIWFVSQTH